VICPRKTDPTRLLEFGPCQNFKTGDFRMAKKCVQAEQIIGKLPEADLSHQSPGSRCY